MGSFRSENCEVGAEGSGAVVEVPISTRQTQKKGGNTEPWMQTVSDGVLAALPVNGGMFQLRGWSSIIIGARSRDRGTRNKIV